KSPSDETSGAEQGITYTLFGLTSFGSEITRLFSCPCQQKADRSAASSLSFSRVVASPSTSPDWSSMLSAASHFLNTPMGTGTASDDDGGQSETISAHFAGSSPRSLRNTTCTSG